MDLVNGGNLIIIYFNLLHFPWEVPDQKEGNESNAR